MLPAVVMEALECGSPPLGILKESWRWRDNEAAVALKLNSVVRVPVLAL